MRIISIFILLLLVLPKLQANHIIGGEMFYDYIGPQGATGLQYKITLKMYRVCYPYSVANGIEDFDGKINLTIFEKTTANNYLLTEVYKEISLSNVEKVIFVKDNPCIKNEPPFCKLNDTEYSAYEVGYYQTIITVGQNTNGYKIVFQRCCRGSITNITDLNTGITLSTDIPGLASGYAKNKSPQFNADKAVLICAGKPFSYSLAGTDADNDILQYSFCNTLDGVNGSEVFLDTAANPSTYKPVVYKNNFSGVIPLGAQVTMSTQTGLITGIAPSEGRYLISVCIQETRNNLIIGIHRKEIILSVADCVKTDVAKLLDFNTDTSNIKFNTCDSYSVTFGNGGAPDKNYYWNFGDGIDTTTTSNSSITHTYNAAGNYNVKLIVNNNTLCSDTSMADVILFPFLKPNFDYSPACVNGPIQFTDASTSDNANINIWKWDFGIASKTDDKDSISNPSYSYNIARNYKVTLTVGDANGCQNSISKTIPVLPTNAGAGADVYGVKDQAIPLNAYGGVNYTWSPTEGLNNPYISNPIVVLNNISSYQVAITTTNGCIINDSLKVNVFKDAAIYVPNAFTPNNDGNNDMFKPVAPGFVELVRFDVYNRFGQVIFSSNDFNKGWNGSINSSPQPTGAYIWLVKAKNANGQIVEKKGTVTLLR